uniref:Uncharacterized protein n=1 Tax=Eutreptiella gymnastica TaxID=73025 RepID=A0A7S4G464_9EUGL|mmetsp:Transcript_98411/g.165705  ORF Transcript_98411/g.165705 Transcript_98411/m.165705 type:complete len:147 (-) Transcript_98411:1373-1813(-)
MDAAARSGQLFKGPAGHVLDLHAVASLLICAASSACPPRVLMTVSQQTRQVPQSPMQEISSTFSVVERRWRPRRPTCFSEVWGMKEEPLGFQFQGATDRPRPRTSVLCPKRVWAPTAKSKGIAKGLPSAANSFCPPNWNAPEMHPT